MTDVNAERQQTQTPTGDEVTPQTPQGTEAETPAEQTTPEVVPPTPEVDYKKKFSESSAEVQRILQDKADLEAKVTELEANTNPSEDVFSDEGKALQGEIKDLSSELSDLKHENAKKDVLIANPILKDKWEELEEFRRDPDNKGMNLKTAAKAFLIEKGLNEPTRPGLEKPSGGDRQPTASGMTVEEVEKLRKTDFKKYQKMLQNGQITFSN